MKYMGCALLYWSQEVFKDCSFIGFSRATEPIYRQGEREKLYIHCFLGNIGVTETRERKGERILKELAHKNVEARKSKILGINWRSRE